MKKMVDDYLNKCRSVVTCCQFPPLTYIIQEGETALESFILEFIGEGV